MNTTQFLIVSVVVLIIAVVLFAGLYFYRKHRSQSVKSIDNVDDMEAYTSKDGPSTSQQLPRGYGQAGGSVNYHADTGIPPNPDGTIPLGYKFVKPTPVSNTPMSTINDNINEYQSVPVDVKEHGVSLINDLSDDEEEGIEEIPDDGTANHYSNEPSGFNLPFDAADVLVIEEAADSPMSFGHVILNVVTEPPRPKIAPEDRVEIIEERTIDNNYITGGDVDTSAITGDDNKPTSDGDEPNKPDNADTPTSSSTDSKPVDTSVETKANTTHKRERRRVRKHVALTLVDGDADTEQINEDVFATKSHDNTGINVEGPPVNLSDDTEIPTRKTKSRKMPEYKPPFKPEVYSADDMHADEDHQKDLKNTNATDSDASINMDVMDTLVPEIVGQQRTDADKSDDIDDLDVHTTFVSIDSDHGEEESETIATTMTSIDEDTEPPTVEVNTNVIADEEDTNDGEEEDKEVQMM